MQTSLVGRIGLLAALLLLTPALPAQDEGTSLREIQVKEILAGCKGATIPELWRRSEQLVALGPAAKRTIQRELRGATVEGRLCGLRALIGLDSPTYAAEKLMDLALDEKLPVDQRLAALELVALTDEVDVEDGLLELLIGFNPRIRIGAARALWQLDTPQSHRAKDVLREFVKSPDPELRAQGALTLAEMGDGATPGVIETLLELRKEPGLRGQLADALYRMLNLRKAIQLYEVRSEKGAAKQSPRGMWSHLDEIRQQLKEKYDLDAGTDDDRLRAGAARGMLDFPEDPHTQFMTPEEYREFLHGSDGVDPAYGGIGAFIDTNVKNSFRILRPIFNGPAWKAGIQGGDDIVAVNGEPTAGRSNTDIIKQIKGPPGTPVILTIFREGWAETRDIKVIRAKIVLPTVTSRMLPGDIGYIAIAQFAYETGKELLQHLHALEKEGVRGLVIDLRDNPGGLLGSVIECLSPFLQARELICSAKGRIYRQERYYSIGSDRKRDYPISVLANARSASGAELMSGVLQHYSRSSELAGADDPYVDAVVIGTTTFGKGSMQRTFALETWKGEEFTDEPRANGSWDPGERFTDTNSNRRWDPTEPFVDRPFLNGRWDDAEPWEDKNGNGTRDPDEAFTDENGDGVWNPAEKFVDANGNGQYDYGAALKMSVARYYLPGGRNFTRTRIFDPEKQNYVYKGGVEPDLKLEFDRMDISRLVELRDLQEKGIFRKYVEERWEEHKETFRKLAEFDGRDPNRYPDFDAFYAASNTRLSRQEVRRALRIEVRRQVSVERGEEILGDLSDDNQLRRGVWEVLRRLGLEPANIPEYADLEASVSAK